MADPSISQSPDTYGGNYPSNYAGLGESGFKANITIDKHTMVKVFNITSVLVCLVLLILSTINFFSVRNIPGDSTQKTNAKRTAIGLIVMSVISMIVASFVCYKTFRP